VKRTGIRTDATKHLVERWRVASPYLGLSPRRLTTLVGLSFTKAVAEVVVLVVVAKVAFALAGPDSADLTVSLGPIRDFSLSPRQAILVALLSALTMFSAAMAIAALAARAAASGAATARTTILRSFSSASWEVQARERTGNLQELVTNQLAQVTVGVAVAVNSATAALSLAALLVGALAANTTAAILMMASVGAISLAMRPLRRITKRISKQRSQNDQEFATGVTEAVSIALEVRVFGVGDAVEGRTRSAIEACQTSMRRLLRMRGFVPAVFQASATLLVLAGMAFVVFAQLTSISGLAVVALLFARALSYGQMFQSALNQVSELTPFVAELHRYEQHYTSAQISTSGAEVERIGDLDFLNVTYSYGDGEPAIQDLTCSLRANERIGLVGPSGSGKSTFVQLLLRLREPDSGLFTVDGCPADQLSLQSWYQRVAIVPQFPHLIEGSVGENIAFFRDVSQEQIVEAAKRANIHEEIVAMSAGYDTLVSGSGGAISGGQAQRICLARALLGTPDVLVLDEPTSALDVRSEAAVQRTLDEMTGSVTLVIIAHRMSTIRHCDRIMVIDGGRLQAFDTPEVLLQQESFFKEAYDLSQG